MEERIVSTRIEKKLHESMKSHDEINWSAVIRNALINKINERESQMNIIDINRTKEAEKLAREIRKSKSFSQGKNSTEIIREWRDRRK
jgi:urease accessory protein UreF